MKKRMKRTIICLILLLIVFEVVLRLGFGFCDALLFQSNDKYEYIAQPSQERRRFGANLTVNSYSQRSEEPDSSKTIVLGLGDSVLFGGSWTDKDSLATTLFSNETGMQMLNISCGSWGPDNAVAYLKEKGTFDAKAMVLVCSSHDAYDRMSFTPVVGILPNYPEKQYKVAIWELIDRYVIPYLTKTKTKTKAAEDRQVIQKSSLFTDGFDNLKQMADSLHIPLYIYLHAEQGELKQRHYNDMGRQIMNWAESAQVMLINGIEEGETESMYHDVIHLNDCGQRHLADVLKKYVKP